MAIDHVVRQAERDAQFAHLVLEQLAQGLEQLQVERIGQAADVVVALDRLCFLRFRAGRFDHVRIDRALRQPARLGQLVGLALEDFDKFAADDLALLFRIVRALQMRQKGFRRIDVNDLDAEVAREGLHHLLRLVQPQQAVVDEHAGELIADRPMDERRRNRRIHAARQAENDFLVTDLLADAGDRFANVVGHVPVMATTANVMDETRQDVLALHRVGDLGVELHPVIAP